MRRSRWIKLIMMVAVFGLLLTACPGGTDDGDTGGAESPTAGGENGGAAQGVTLQEVRDLGTLTCGVNGQLPGFSFVDEEGNWSGFDVDYCRALAAAVLDDPEAVEYRALTTTDRFTALQSREIDVLIRNTTRTATRDGGEGATFATTTFYDGQGMMVAADSDIESLEDLDGATICVQAGTTTELNLTTAFESRGLTMTPQTFDDIEGVQSAFEAGQCQGWTSDRSQLAALRQNYPAGPDALRILDVVMSKEPLGPVTRDGDSQWSQIVDWVVIATIQAEAFADEKGGEAITQANVEGFETEDPDILRFLGQAEEGEPFDPGIGLDPEWTVRVISAVGNYGEIYERHLAPLAIEREGTANALWTQGGLHYPPPYR